MEKTELNPSEKKTGGLVKGCFDLLDIVISAVVMAVVVFAFIGRTAVVDGDSMNPTLHDTERLIVTDLFYTPDNGDIVVIEVQGTLDKPIVKRVIATEGQTVDIDYATGTVYVDGEALEEDYISEPLVYDPRDVSFPRQVPQGCVFVLGDNRNASEDSRKSTVGMVDMRHIIGHPILRIAPFTLF